MARGRPGARRNQSSVLHANERAIANKQQEKKLINKKTPRRSTAADPASGKADALGERAEWETFDAPFSCNSGRFERVSLVVSAVLLSCLNFPATLTTLKRPDVKRPPNNVPFSRLRSMRTAGFINDAQHMRRLTRFTLRLCMRLARRGQGKEKASGF